MMGVFSVKTSIGSDGIESKTKRGICMIDLTSVQHIEKVDMENTEVVMKSGDRFFVKKPTFDEFVELLKSI